MRHSAARPRNKSIPNTVDLGNQLENFISGLVKSARYNSKSDAIRVGGRLLQGRETRFAALDAAIARGITDVDAGRVKPLSQVFDRLEAKYREAIDADTEPR